MQNAMVKTGRGWNWLWAAGKSYGGEESDQRLRACNKPPGGVVGPFGSRVAIIFCHVVGLWAGLYKTHSINLPATATPPSRYLPPASNSPFKAI